MKLDTFRLFLFDSTTNQSNKRLLLSEQCSIGEDKQEALSTIEIEVI